MQRTAIVKEGKVYTIIMAPEGHEPDEEGALAVPTDRANIGDRHENGEFIPHFEERKMSKAEMQHFACDYWLGVTNGGFDFKFARKTVRIPATPRYRRMIIDLAHFAETRGQAVPIVLDKPVYFSADQLIALRDALADFEAHCQDVFAALIEAIEDGRITSASEITCPERNPALKIKPWEKVYGR